MEKMNFRDSVSVQIERGPNLDDTFDPKGKFYLEIFDQVGNLKYREDITNTVVNVGKNSLLDINFRNQTQIATWYIGLMDATGYSSNPVTDTMSSHAGWTEFQNYDEAARQTWSTSAAASQSITNGTPATFTISATGTLKGIFIVSNNSKGGTTGTLWSTATFASNLPVVDNDLVKITYTLSC